MTEASSNRCEICPMRVLPPSRKGRLLFKILHADLQIPKPPSEAALEACPGSPDVQVGEVWGNYPGGLPIYSQTVEGTCPAEDTRVVSDHRGVEVQRVLESVKE